MNELRRKVPLRIGAARAGMCETTARKYLRAGEMPGELAVPHTWRTRPDPFESVSDLLDEFLSTSPGLRATTLIDYLQREFPGRFTDGQLRSLQRRIKVWRATKGPSKEVYFAQEHVPGDLCQSDFCHMGRLGVTLYGQPFNHLIYHFVLTYSNWEYAHICFSESFESLCEGIQGALWSLGGVPKRHRTDSLTAAVTNIGNTRDDRQEFTERYQALMRHYGLAAEHTQPSRPNENGDVEQSHNQLVRRIDQALMLRGNRDFEDRAAYSRFLLEQCSCGNLGRAARLTAETPLLHALPSQRHDGRKRLLVRVGPGSTIRVQDNVYAVPSRLIGERVEAVIAAEEVAVHYAQQEVVRLPRLRGKGGHSIDYRHIIDWLVKKPGAFDQYVYRAALFPSSHFRIAYDALTATRPVEGKREYLLLLKLAADEGQQRVEEVLRTLVRSGVPLRLEAVRGCVLDTERAGIEADSPRTIVQIPPVDLNAYDSLLPLHEGAEPDCLLDANKGEEVPHA